MILKTNNYDMFVFRADNREKIDNFHVKRLKESISSRNLLELRPICVNENMEIIDGQHRLLAARELGVDIYYIIEKSIKISDVILMNVSKAWGNRDYLNYYIKNNFEEYIKLDNFCTTNNLALSIALIMLLGRGRQGFHLFRKGEFVFNHSMVENELSTCWEIINFVKKSNGFSIYTSTGRFWKALVNVVKHPNFNKEKMFSNLERLVERMRPKVSGAEYFKMLVDIHNWKNHNKIHIVDADAISPISDML